MKLKNKKQRLLEKRIKLKNKKLLKEYPFLAPINWYTCSQLPKNHPYYYSCTALDDMPKGWKKAFGVQLAEDIKKELKKKNIKNYCVMQVKEKYGSLRWYDNYRLDCMDRYEKLSERTCVVCGKPATRMSTGWICPYCDNCSDKYIINEYVPIEKWFSEDTDE